MKGVILAGGSGTRLAPLTTTTSKQLMPVYDKPMIYYPMSTLMLGNIREFVVICTPESEQSFVRLLGDGSSFGLSISYVIQEKPNGIADALLLAENFVGRDPFTLVLGDNIFYGNGVSQLLIDSFETPSQGAIFVQHVENPREFGVLKNDSNGQVVDILEKPVLPPTNLAVTGLYQYSQEAIDAVRDLRPSNRGELEITDLNRVLLTRSKLKVNYLPRGCAWFDTGNPDNLFEASSFVRAVEMRQGLKISCPEEIAIRRGFISIDELEQYLKRMPDNRYYAYLRGLVDRGEFT